MKKFGIYEDQEKDSFWGIPIEGSRVWYWEELDSSTKAPTENIGWLRALTEIEALRRLREAWPEIGQIRWIHRDDYKTYESINKGPRL